MLPVPFLDCIGFGLHRVAGHGRELVTRVADHAPIAAHAGGFRLLAAAGAVHGVGDSGSRHHVLVD